MSSLGQTISGGANVLRGFEAGQQRQRDVRMQQLAIEEQNRANRLRQLAAQQPIPQAPDLAANLGQGMPVANVPIAGTGTGAGAAAAPTTTGNAAIEQRRLDAMRNNSRAAQAEAMRRRNAGASLTQQQRDRISLSKFPAALADVVQLPAAVGLNVLGSAASGVQNVAGRVVNAITGEEILPTDTQYPTYSATPFYDRFVRQPEQAEKDAQAAAAARVTPATRRTVEPATPERGSIIRTVEFAPGYGTPMVSETPTTATKKAQQYDNRTTQYDDLMNEAAQQYGLDPVMFKRLIGTESSFNPNAVSPSGRNAGLGIAQINAVHGMSDADRLNPQVAIPFAAQLYAQYLEQAGGDHAEALMRYKGASSEKGRAAMQAPIQDILSGTPMAPAAAQPEITGAPTTPVENVAAATRKDPADFYLANAQAIPRDMQLALQGREELVRMAQLYQQSGMGLEFMQVRAEILKADNNMFYLQGMQGLQELEMANDPRRLATIWSEATGVPVGVQPRTDGKFNVFVNGRVTREGISSAQLADSARSSFDSAFRQQKGAASAAFNEKLQASMLKIQEGNALELAKTIRETTVEGVKGNNARALEYFKANANWDIKPTGAGDGTIIIRPPGSPPYLFNPAGRVIEIDGVKVPANSAILIGGLPLPTQARLNQVR